MQQKCASCHSSYQTFSGVSRDIKRIQQAIASGEMPRRPQTLSSQEKTALLNGISQGYKEVSALTSPQMPGGTSAPSAPSQPSGPSNNNGSSQNNSSSSSQGSLSPSSQSDCDPKNKSD